MKSPVPDALVPAVSALCDLAQQRIEKGEVFAAYRLLGPELSRLIEAASATGAEQNLVAQVRNHAVFGLCQQDPYTARAYEKPRGYPGDAVMLDFVYSGRPPDGTSDLGRQLFLATTRVPMGLSVLYRRSLLRAYIDDQVARRPGCRILSVASGHCREVEGSLLFRDGFDSEFIALDQDAETAAVVAREYPHPRLRTMTGRVRDLVFGRLDIGEFDFIYSAGLYDYLPDATAAQLTAQLVSMLTPDGRLLLANFLPSCYGRGYLETFMDWRLKYRSPDELRELFPEALRNFVQTTTDPHGNVVYAVLARPAPGATLGALQNFTFA